MPNGPPGNEGIVECPDGHRCENGSLCVENPYDEGNYYCDCDAASLNSAYQGLYCEHEATEYCSYKGAVSRNSFCTNGGKCIANVGEDEAHLGCDCPEEYDGEHCQFIKGTKPSGWPYTKDKVDTPGASTKSVSGGGGGGLTGGAIFGIIVAVVAFVLVGAFFVRRTMRRERGDRQLVQTVGSSSPTKGPVMEHNLDPDGGTLPKKADNSGDYDIGVEDIMANEDEDGEII